MSLFELIKFGSIIGRYLVGEESKEELEILNKWLQKDPDNRMFFSELQEKKNISSALNSFESYDEQFAWERYAGRISALSYKKVLVWWRAAAIFLFLICSSGLILYSISDGRSLFNGKSNYTTVSTTKGRSSKIMLPDSSVVWINSETYLSYNTDFGIKKRDIHLVGQAFFEVAKNESMPLTVSCSGINVKVLGTRFDISAYPEDQDVRVVLETGKIELSDKDSNFKSQMNPGEMGKYDLRSGGLTLVKVHSRKFTSWKDGILIFENDPMSDVFEKLERWYNIDIAVENQEIYQLIFNATIVNENFDEIFELIKFTCGINYQIIPSDNPEIPVKLIVTK